MNTKECEESLSFLKAKALLKLRPLYSSMVVSIKWKFVDQDITAHTDGISVTVGIKFWSKLDNKERLFLMLHEICHVLLMHVVRFQSLKAKAKDAAMYNAAADYFINLMLLDDNTKELYAMPKGESAGLYDEQYRDMSTDEIYKLLIKNNTKVPLSGMEGDLKSSKHSNDIGKKAEVLDIIKNAVMKDKNAGFNRSDIFSDALDTLFKEPKINWKSALKKYATQLFRIGKGYQKLHRRTMFNKKLYIKTPRTDVRIEDVLIYIDVSVSCSNEDITNMLTELHYITKKFKPKKILFSTFNTEICETFTIKSLKDIPTTIKVRGGTEVQVCIDHINQYKSPVSVAIIMSDAYTPSFSVPNKVPLLMLVINNPDYEKDKVKVIHYEN